MARVKWSRACGWYHLGSLWDGQEDPECWVEVGGGLPTIPGARLRPQGGSPMSPRLQGQLWVPGPGPGTMASTA